MQGTDLALAKVQRACRQLPADQHSPEMLHLLAGLQGLQAAEGELRQADQQAGPRELFLYGAEEEPLLFKGLVHFLEAVVANSAAGVYTCGRDLSDLLLRSSLMPLAQSNAQATSASYSLPVDPDLDEPVLGPMVVMQLLVASFQLHAVASDDKLSLALRLASVAFDALWPEARDAQRAQRVLEGRGWVPSFPDQPVTSPAVPAGSSQLAFELLADLRRYCPGIRLSDVQRWALMLRVWSQHDLLQAGHGSSPEAVSAFRQQAIDCQQLLWLAAHDGTMPGIYQIAEYAAAAVSCSMEGWDAARGRMLTELYQEALRRAEANKCWVQAAGLAVAHGYWCMLQQRALRSLNRAASTRLIEQAQQLAARVRTLEPVFKPWLPASRMQLIVASRQGLERDAVMPTGRAVQACLRGFEEPEMCCAYCSAGSLHLRKCAACQAVAYCSRECQKKHWKESGHRQECAQLAAQRTVA